MNDEKGRKYEINVDGVRVYFDDTRPNLVYEYHIMIDEFGNSWEYTVLEGGVLEDLAFKVRSNISSALNSGLIRTKTFLPSISV